MNDKPMLILDESRVDDLPDGFVGWEITSLNDAANNVRRFISEGSEGGVNRVHK